MRENASLTQDYDVPEPLFGVYPAIVVENIDPEGQGRVQVHLPVLSERAIGWARISTLTAGEGRGSFFIPDVDDEVLVAFEAGDARRPYVLGCLWNDRARPPESVSSGENTRKLLRTRSGVQITIDDTGGRESLVLETPAGGMVTLQDASRTVEIRDTNGNRILLASDGITIQSASKVRVSASNVEVSASILDVNAAMSRFQGVVQADTLITNSVVSSSYTPGAGNIW